MVRKSHPARLVISPVCVQGRETEVSCSVLNSGSVSAETHVAEGGSHDDGLVAVDLVVVVDLGDGNNSGVVGSLVVAIGLVGLVPVEDATDERRDEGDTGLSAGNGLSETEEEREVAVDLVLSLELAGSLNSLPGGSDLDENAVLGDSNRLVESDQGLGLWCSSRQGQRNAPEESRPPTLAAPYLGLGGLLVKGEGSINLGGDTSGNNGKDLLSELDEL